MITELPFLKFFFASVNIHVLEHVMIAIYGSEKDNVDIFFGWNKPDFILCLLLKLLVVDILIPHVEFDALCTDYFEIFFCYIILVFNTGIIQTVQPTYKIFKIIQCLIKLLLIMILFYQLIALNTLNILKSVNICFLNANFY
jgi:hypothetical protein